MIDSTVIQMGPIEIGSNTYIGPYCVLGFPLKEEIKSEDINQENSNRPFSRGVKIGENCTFLSHIVIGEDSIIGHDVWCEHHSYIGSSTNISDGVEIMYGARIYHRVAIGEKAWIGSFVCDDAVIEPKAVILGKLVHNFVNAIVDVPEKAPRICEGAFIGVNAVVIGGIEVGTGAYIAAGSVLTKSALPGRLYMGTPAKNVGPAPSAFKIKERR